MRTPGASAVDRLASRSASHSLSLGLKRQQIMALGQVSIPAAQAVPLIKQGAVAFACCMEMLDGEVHEASFD